MSSINVSGLDKLLKQLSNIDKDLKDEELKRALVNQASIVRDEAKLLCPVDSGNLRRSIHASTKVETDEYGNMCGFVYTNCEYAP